MSASLQRAIGRVERQRKRNPEVVRLATLACLAVRLESHLLRRLRLALLPDADVGIEADLWFSPLVDSRGAQAIVLNRDVAELLRSKLAEDRALLRQVITLTGQAHAGAAATIQLEERLAGLVLLDEPDAAQAIDEALRPALRTLEAGGEGARQLAQWALRALSDAHPRLRECRNAVTLALGSALALGGRPILASVPTLAGDFGDMAWLLRGAVQAAPARIGVAWTADGVAFSAPGDGLPLIELPATRPLLLSLEWQAGDGAHRQLVEVVAGGTVEFGADVTEVTLGTLAGDEYRLSAVAAAEPSPQALAEARFEIDVFISYAHADNGPLRPGESGWVDRFHDTLEAMVRQRLGGRPRFWRDTQLAGTDRFAEERLDRLQRAAVLVAIVTSHYLESARCQREFEFFFEHAERSGGLVVANRSRVFKVLMRPMASLAELPPAVSGMLSYEFFSEQDGRVVELDPALRETSRPEYLRRTAALASDICRMLEQTSRPVDSGSLAGQAGAARMTVYLAECAADLREAREKLKADLMMRGLVVLPEAVLPVDEAGCAEAVQSQLACADLAVHLVGASQGTLLDGPAGKSMVMLQIELAAEQSRQTGLPRVIWLPQELRAVQQQVFIDALHNDPGTQFGAELLVGPMESLKTSIQDMLGKLLQQEPPAVPTSTAPQILREILRDLAVIRAQMPVVFLAETGFPEHEWRKTVRRELLQRDDLIVLPAELYHWHSPSLESNINADLDRAELCVHVVPPGLDAEGEHKVRRQLEMAVQMMRDKARPMPLVCVPSAALGPQDSNGLIAWITEELPKLGVQFSQTDSYKKFWKQLDERLGECVLSTRPALPGHERPA